MSLKQSVSLKLGQSLTMTPALQQAIRMLQLSTLDLHMEIQQALESNLMLETEEQEVPTVEQSRDNESDRKSSDGEQHLKRPREERRRQHGHHTCIGRTAGRSLLGQIAMVVGYP